MSENEIILIEDSWDYILMNTEEAGKIFYSILFQNNPELQSMFTTDIDEQSRKLISLITFAVQKLRNLETIKGDVEALGKRHDRYGVKLDHYPLVGNALVSTLKIGLGEDWTDELEKAWVKLYGKLTQIMTESDGVV